MAKRKDIVENLNEDTLNLSKYPEAEMLNERLEWFQDMKLGIIIHWGLYAQAGIVESWQLSDLDEWAREPLAWRDNQETLKLDYWNLVSEFNPTDYNPSKWADLFKRAGAKYAIFTTKHHDGFNMYNTLESDYKIGGKLSPFREDVTKRFTQAMTEQNIHVGLYYSKADWYRSTYWLDDSTKKGRHASYDTEEFPEIWEKYVDFVHNQIEELMSNYGKVDILWMDAGWSGYGKEDLKMDLLVEKARSHQEDLIVVNRAMGDRHENYITPERKIPTINEIPQRAWESNIPLGNDWGYVPTDTFKSSAEIIKSFVDIVAKGGNLILGVGPTPEGTITLEEQAILEDLGKWLAIYGEGIYDTRPYTGKNLLEKGWYITQKEKEDLFIFIKEEELEEKSQIAVKDLVDVKADAQINCTDMLTGEIQTVDADSILQFKLNHSQSSQPVYGYKIRIN